MYLNDRDSLTVPLDYGFIGSCFCGQSYFHASSVGHIVSSGGAHVMAWQVVTTPYPFPAYLNQEASLPVQQQYGDGGFFTSISSNGETGIIIWAVPRPDTTQVLLYAFEATQVAGHTALKQVFKANAGTWTNPLYFANANIVPVVANGKVFVASYGQLNIFGIIPNSASATQRNRAVGAPQTPMPPTTQRSTHEVFGAIESINGSQLTIRLRGEKLLQVDATAAIEQQHSTQLFIGRSVAAEGTYDAQGALHADHIYRVKTSVSWPDDR